jgi:hypothetical protein
MEVMPPGGDVGMEIGDTVENRHRNSLALAGTRANRSMNRARV